MVIGRGDEVARIEQLLARARLGTSEVFVLVGDAGIGKTALLEHAVDRAGGMAVLRARGVLSEAEIPFAGLHALLQPVVARIAALPGPQAAALEVALGLMPGPVVDRFGIGAATLALLAAVAEQMPLLVVLDDAQWIDESSLGAIVFAARRLLADAIAIVIATRPDGPAVLDGAGFATVALAGLDREAAGELLERRAGAPLDPGVAERLFEVTLGNPLALVELAARPSGLAPGRTSVLETTVEHAFAQRLAALPAATRELLGLAAAEDAGDLAVLDRAAAALGLALDALEPAEQCGLISVGEEAVAFCHPLARAAAYRAGSSPRRRAAHLALADADADPDRRAWHRAAGLTGADGDAAEGLEQAAARARARGGFSEAATSLDRAAALSPTAPERARRLFAAAEAAWLAGHAGRALERLDAARVEADDAPLQREIDHLRGHAAMRSGRMADAEAILLAAAAEAPGDQAAVMLAEATDACLYAARPAPMLRAARGAWAALTPASGERARFLATLALGQALVYGGRGAEGADLLREAVALLERSDALADDPRLRSSAALGPLWLREAARSRALVTRAIEDARRQGAVGALPFSLWLAARDAATSDRPALAVALYEEAIRLARETRQATSLCAGLAGLACVEARQGREDDCRAHVEEALALTGPLGLAFFELWALDAGAELELGRGEVEAAVGWLERKERLLAERAIADPDVSPAPELVEALVRAGRAPEARPRLAAFAVAARVKGQPWSLARLARAEGLLDGQDTAFAHALDLHARTPDRFETARTRLAHGEVLRRGRRRVDARGPLRLALAELEALGAAPWAERARAELQASGETARRRDAAHADALTPRELQVALALADGHTLREAGAKLFLSPKTVDHHLRQVYRKLEVNSRAALAAALAEHQEPS